MSSRRSDDVGVRREGRCESIDRNLGEAIEGGHRPYRRDRGRVIEVIEVRTFYSR